MVILMSNRRWGSTTCRLIFKIMKNLLSLLLLISFTSWSQNYISLSPEVEPIIEEFIEDAYDRGYFVRSYLYERIDAIVFNEMLSEDIENRIGIVDESYRIIFLSTKIKDNSILLKLTVYHEIGHLLKGPENIKHPCINCSHIMAEYAPSDLLPYYNKDYMKQRVDEYFDWLTSRGL